MAEKQNNKRAYNFIDLTGQTIEKWRVISLSHYAQSANSIYWLCICECGTKRCVNGAHLRSHRTKSCGCHKQSVLRNNHLFKHGGHGTREYNAWRGAKNRCYQTAHTGYRNYGGRGIAMCQEWRDDFARFLADMGPCPAGLTLDRINNDGNYEPGNCRWATRSVQAKNKRHPKSNLL